MTLMSLFIRTEYTCVTFLRTLIVGAMASLRENNEFQGVEVLAKRHAGVQAGVERGPRIRFAPEGKHLAPFC